MAKKINRKKARIKLNEEINRQLDAMEDNNAIEVFQPKKSKDADFYSLVDEAMGGELIGDVDSSNNKTSSNKIETILGILVLCVLFVGFVILLTQISI